MVYRRRQSYESYEQRHRRMIAETSAFLSWALRHPEQVPRLPRRRVDEGGFKAILSRPGAREAVRSFWRRTLG